MDSGGGGASKVAVGNGCRGVGVLSFYESERRDVVRRLTVWRRLTEVIGELGLVIPMNLREVMRFEEQKEFVEEILDFDGGFIAESRQVDFDRHGIGAHGYLRVVQRADAARRGAGVSG